MEFGCVYVQVTALINNGSKCSAVFHQPWLCGNVGTRKDDAVLRMVSKDIYPYDGRIDDVLQIVGIGTGT